jgi:hypothetical protein
MTHDHPRRLIESIAGSCTIEVKSFIVIIIVGKEFETEINHHRPT